MKSKALHHASLLILLSLILTAISTEHTVLNASSDPHILSPTFMPARACRGVEYDPTCCFLKLSAAVSVSLDVCPSNELYLDFDVYQEDSIIYLPYDLHFIARDPQNRPILFNQQFVVPDSVTEIRNASFTGIIARGSLFYRVKDVTINWLSFTNVDFEQTDADKLAFRIKGVTLVNAITFTNCLFTSPNTASYTTSFAMIETTQWINIHSLGFLGELVFDGLRFEQPLAAHQWDVLTLDLLHTANVVVKNAVVSSTSVFSFYRAYNVTIQDSTFSSSGASFVTSSLITLSDVVVTGRPTADYLYANTEAFFVFYESYPTLANATVHLLRATFENITKGPVVPEFPLLEGGVIYVPATQNAVFSHFNVSHCSFNNFSNGVYAIKNADVHQAISAKLNWWGSAGGPNDPCSKNVRGVELYWNRENTKNHVDFSPWCSTASCSKTTTWGWLRKFLCRTTFHLVMIGVAFLIALILLGFIIFGGFSWFRHKKSLRELKKADADAKLAQDQFDRASANYSAKYDALDANFNALDADFKSVNKNLELLNTQLAEANVKYDTAKSFERVTCRPRAEVELMSLEEIDVFEISNADFEVQLSDLTVGGRGNVKQAVLRTPNLPRRFQSQPSLDVIVKFPRTTRLELNGNGDVVKVELSNAEKEQNRKALRWELYLLHCFGHPTFPVLLGFTKYDGEEGIVMLRMYPYQIKAHRTDPRSPPFDTVMQVALGISFLHSHRIIHGDLKPANLLFSGRTHKQVVIADLGDSYFLPNKQTRLRTPYFGTKGYACPHYRENHKLSMATDIYSFGKTIFAIYTGLEPLDIYFEPSTVKGFDTQVSSNTSELELPTPIRHIISQCIQNDPATRPEIAELILQLSAISSSPNPSLSMPSSSSATTSPVPDTFVVSSSNSQAASREVASSSEPGTSRSSKYDESSNLLS